MTKVKSRKPKSLPAQHQKVHPGKESLMYPQPEYIQPGYKGSGKLLNKVAIITGGDSGIGRAVAVHFAHEGANVVVVYLNEHGDAKKTRLLVESTGAECLLIAGNLGDVKFCKKVVASTLKRFGKIDVLVNNAAEQHFEEDFTKIPHKQIEKTFRTNIFSMFYLTQQVLPHLQKGSAIVNCTSVTAYRGSKHMIDYASTKGAILAFTRSLSANLADEGIRVNGVAPGPIWTPFIPSSFPAEKVKDFGKD
ncbi:MAG TPA: SDR family NAD(P)-dependent oxidoreductase, partial [Chitinophagales bacterium]|nr:SDR family NAD(P)-dependent oxidoreductase [Chitinophagales bacterium]